MYWRCTIEHFHDYPSQVQSLNSLRQRLMDDRALESQLRDIAWSAAFDAPPPRFTSTAAVPSNSVMGTEGNGSLLGTSRLDAEAAPGPGSETRNQLLRSLSHRMPWQAPAGAAPNLPATALPMTLRRMALLPRGGASDGVGYHEVADGGGGVGGSVDVASMPRWRSSEAKETLVGSLLLSPGDASQVGGLIGPRHHGRVYSIMAPAIMGAYTLYENMNYGS